MKKSLVALAALAATSAFAQSSVEIYGILDVGQVKLSGQEAGINNTTNSYPISQSASGLANAFARQGTGTNHMGFRGREDLGGGMYAGFDLQTGGLDLATGAPALAFSRESNLKLGSSSWGELKVGRSVSTLCAIGCSFDYNYIGSGSAYAMQGLSVANNRGSSRRSDQIEFTSLPMSGFVGKFSIQQRGDQNQDGSFVTNSGITYASSATAAGTSTKVSNYKTVYAYGGTYTNGNLRVAGAVETKQSDSNAIRNAQFLAAEYNFGFLKANVQSFTNNSKGGKAVPNAAGTSTSDVSGQIGLTTAAGVTTYGKGNGISLIAPVGKWNFGAQYAKNTEQGTKATELFARYDLSKRTTVYFYNTKLNGTLAISADAGYADAAAAAAAGNPLRKSAVQADPTITAFGIRHSF